MFCLMSLMYVTSMDVLDSFYTQIIFNFSIFTFEDFSPRLKSLKLSKDVVVFFYVR